MRLYCYALVGACLLALPTGNYAIVLLDSSDPNHNTTAPTGNLAGSGWDYQGTWGAFLGTPIDPSHFIAAKHVGGTVGNTFTFRGANYTTTAKFDHPDSGVDLTLWRVSGTFPDYARLYSRWAILDETLVAHGRSGPRGAAANAPNGCFMSPGFRGWKHTGYDGIMRWGSADNAYQAQSGFGSGVFLPYNWINKSPSNTTGDFGLALGDSSGGAFVHDRFLWRIAGLGHSFTGRELRDTVGGSPFYATILTSDGGFLDANGNTYCPGLGATINRWTEVGSYFGWIYSVISTNILHLGRATILYNGDFAMEIGGNLGTSVTVQASTDHVTWTSIATVTANNAFRLEFVDTAADQYQGRIYRVVSSSGLQSRNGVGFERVAVDATQSAETKTVLKGYQFVNYLGDYLPPLLQNIHGTAVPYPNGAMVYKWNPTTQAYSSSVFDDIANDWLPAKNSFDTGEALMITAPVGEKVEFVIAGERLNTATLTIHPGFNLITYPFPKSVTGNTLGLQPLNGDEIHKLTDGDGQLGYAVYTYQNNAWSPSVPQLGVGEGFWYNSSRTSDLSWNPTSNLW